MFELKRLSREGVPAALAKAERYRLLNEPWEAESICHDILTADPENQEARAMLLLALTDQFETDTGSEIGTARALLGGITDPYERERYSGIVCERWAKRFLRHDTPGSGPIVYAWLRRAMDHFEAAERIRPAGDDDAILRWNTCARLIQRNPRVRPSDEASAAAIELE